MAARDHSEQGVPPEGHLLGVRAHLSACRRGSRCGENDRLRSRWWLEEVNFGKTRPSKRVDNFL
jgi:hypothetical protein